MEKSQNNKQKLTRFNKSDANRKTSILFTQLGLVLALLMTYIAIESKVIINDATAGIPVNPFPIDDTFIPDTTPEKVKPIERIAKTIPEPILDIIQIIENDPNLAETLIDVQTLNPDGPVKIVKIPDYIPIESVDKEDVPFILIEDAPKYPGCKGTKEEIKKCFSDSVRKLVAKKFNGGLAPELGLPPGKKRISVQFTVNKEGKIADVLVRAPHKSLENEARRVVNLLPEMIPGKQRGRAVGVKFTLPITFQVE